MGFFSRLFRPEDHLRTVLGRVEEVESKLRRLEGEWTDAYEKLARLSGRIRKRAERELSVAAEVEPAEEAVTRSETPWEKRRNGIKSRPGGTAA